MIRVMVVGVGTIGSVHVASFAKMKEVKLLAVVDKRGSCAKTVKTRL